MKTLSSRLVYATLLLAGLTAMGPTAFADAWNSAEPVYLRGKEQRYLDSRDDMIATRTHADVGLYWGNYDYSEPSLNVGVEGRPMGATLGVTFAHKKLWLRTELDGHYFNADYRGSGTKDENETWTGDARAYVGYDIRLSRNNQIAPFAGIGYRHHLNDLRGRTSTNAVGYRRENQMTYVPLGVVFRNTSIGRPVNLHLEGDWMLQGKQRSYLMSDVGTTANDIENKQSDGFGMRAQLSLDLDLIEVGGFYQYWQINDSDQVFDSLSAAFWSEPRNHTEVYGIFAKYKFNASK